MVAANLFPDSALLFEGMRRTLSPLGWLRHAAVRQPLGRANAQRISALWVFVGRFTYNDLSKREAHPRPPSCGTQITHHDPQSSAHWYCATTSPFSIFKSEISAGSFNLSRFSGDSIIRRTAASRVA